MIKKSRIQIKRLHRNTLFMYITICEIHCWKWFCYSIFASWYIPLSSLFYQRCLSRIWYQCVKFDECRSNKKIASKYCNVSWQQSSSIMLQNNTYYIYRIYQICMFTSFTCWMILQCVISCLHLREDVFLFRLTRSLAMMIWYFVKCWLAWFEKST